jgi:hypothetical protein
MQDSEARVHMFIPENFEAESILNTVHFERSDGYAKLKARMYYILHTLYKMSQSREWREFYEVNGGYPLQASLLDRLLGKKYRHA